MIYGVTAVLIAVNLPRFFNVVRKDKLLLLLNLLGMISVSWSEDPWLFAREGLVLFLTYASGAISPVAIPNGSSWTCSGRRPSGAASSASRSVSSSRGSG